MALKNIPLAYFPLTLIGADNEKYRVIGINAEIEPFDAGRIVIGLEKSFSEHNPYFGMSISFFIGPPRKTFSNGKMTEEE